MMSVQSLFSGCFFLIFFGCIAPHFYCTEPFQPACLLTSAAVGWWSGWRAGRVVDGWATVDVDAASDNFVATRHLIHACCASVKDRGSASAGSGIAMCWLGLANIECFRQHRNQRPAVD